MADGSEKLAKARAELLILRSRLINLLDKPQPFLSVKAAIKNYVLLLLRHRTNIHESRSDLQVDLGILRDLRPKLEAEHTEAEQEFFNAQMSISCAHRIKYMMLLELKGFLENQIPDSFRKWIVQQLDGEIWEVDGENSEVDGEYYSVVDGENRVDKLQLWDARIEKLRRRAEAKGGQLREHKIDYEEFDADNPELVMGRFEAHQKAIDHAHEKANENLCACTQIPAVCESFKKLELYLEARCSRIPDDSIEEAEESQEAHQSKHTGDGAKARTAEGSETKLAMARQELQIFRKRLTDLWLKPEPFLSVEGVINKYVLLLFRHISSIHEFVIDLQDDLAILKGLQLKLEGEQTEAKQEFSNAQMSIACAQRIESMMLGKLHSFLNKEISDCFREWIKQHLDGKNWVDMLQFSDARIEELKRGAKAEGGRLRKHKMDYEEFDADNAELVIDQFMAHQKALALVLKSTNENICAYTHIPEMCESLKKLELSLVARWLSVREPEDIIKRLKPREGCSKC